MKSSELLKIVKGYVSAVVLVSKANYVNIPPVLRVFKPGIFKTAQKVRGYVYACVLISEFICIIIPDSARRHISSHILKAFQWKFEAMKNVT